MASVYVDSSEYLGGLPPVCAKCGEPAEDTVRKTFSWAPGWVLAFVLLGLLPLLIAWLIATKRATVFVPMCEEHKHHWRWRSQTLWLTIVLIVVLLISGLVLVSSVARFEEMDHLLLMVWLVSGGLFLAWLIAAAVLSSSAIRPEEITAYDMKLIKVSPDFRDAVHDMRRSYREQRRGPLEADEPEDRDHPDDRRITRR